MRIILGSVLLAVAFAAPIDFEETPVTTTPTKPLARVEVIIENARYYMGAQDGAILESFVQRFDIDPPSKEQYDRVLEWGKKWNIDMVKTLRYDAENNRIYSTERDIDARDSQGNPVHQQAKPAERLVLSDEEFNARAIKHESLLRHLLQQEGLSEQAVDEYFAQGLQLLPIDMNKYFILTDFCKKWGIERVESIQLFADLIVTGAEEMPAPTAVATEQEQAQIENARIFGLSYPGLRLFIPHAFSTGRPGYIIEQNNLSRRKLRDLGFPEQAIDEFILSGFAVRPIDDDMRVVKMKWMNKWKQFSPRFQKKEAIRKETVREGKRIITNMYEVLDMTQKLLNYEELTKEKMQSAKEFFENLPEYERELLQKLMNHIESEIKEKYRHEVEQSNNEEPAETTPSPEETTTAEQFRGVNDLEEMDKAGKIDFNNY